MHRNDHKARPTYSRLRTSILKLTPGDNKCRLYCKGISCKYCTTDGSDTKTHALRGLYSTWVTDEILAMARLFDTHFEHYDIIKQFHNSGIKAVINLEQQGEHAFCGTGLRSSGFSYEPEELMKNNNFGSCSPEHLLDIAKVAKNALASGKLAIHCHAGHGRTGMVIAAVVMFKDSLSAFEAVKLVRNKRSQSVQSISQVETLNQFEQLIFENETKYRNRQFGSIKDFVNFDTFLLNKAESRIYGLVPKVVYESCHQLLKEFYESVHLELRFSENLASNIFFYQLGCEKNIIISEEHLLILRTDRLQVLNEDATGNEDAERKIPMFVRLLGGINDFLMNNFHQLCSSAELVQAVQKENFEVVHDWQWTLNVLLSTGSHLPFPLLPPFSKLCSLWFSRKDDCERVIHDHIIELRKEIVTKNRVEKAVNNLSRDT